MAKCCAMCGKSLGMFSGKAELEDGFICGKCMRTGGMVCGEKLHVTVQEMITLIKEHVAMKKGFHPSKKSKWINADTRLHVFKIGERYYPFSKLVSYSYREDPENQHISQFDGKAGGAMVGGIIGGLSGGIVARTVGASAGAAIGGIVGGLFSSMCNYMYIKATLDDPVTPEEKKSFIYEKTRVSSEEYRDAVKDARDCIEILEMILQYNSNEKRATDAQSEHERALQENEKTVFIQSGHLSAEEINRELTAYRTMMASGLITEDEYNEKKKQLLSLK